MNRTALTNDIAVKATLKMKEKMSEFFPFFRKWTPLRTPSVKWIRDRPNRGQREESVFEQEHNWPWETESEFIFISPEIERRFSMETTTPENELISIRHKPRRHNVTVHLRRSANSFVWINIWMRGKVNIITYFHFRFQMNDGTCYFSSAAGGGGELRQVRLRWCLEKKLKKLRRFYSAEFQWNSRRMFSAIRSFGGCWKVFFAFDESTAKVQTRICITMSVVPTPTNAKSLS